MKPGTNAWHLNGKVTAYRAIYCDSKGNELANFTPNQAPKYYLKGAANIGVSTEEPATVPDGKEFDRWVTNDEDVTVKNDTFIMPDHDVKFTPKWKPITADLIDNDITIKHGVNAAPADGDDPTAHIVEKNATISYQATLDMKNLDFGANPEHADTVLRIRTAMADIGTASLWDFIKNNSIGIFAGSEVNLHVKFSDKLVNPATLDGTTLKSGWFKLDPNNKLTYNNTTGYWTIPCVIKDATAPDIDTNDSIITLSGITLPLTADAQGKLNSNTALDIISEGYIDGTIMISGQTLKLESKTAKNTAKLKLAVPTYTVTYTDGAGGAAFNDKTYSNILHGAPTPAFGGTPERDGYTFNGWKPTVKATVTNDATYTATWTRNSSRDDDDDKYYFAIQKVDAQDGHALNGAKFELYQLDKNDRIKNRRVVETRQQSSKNGIALFGVDNKNSYDGIWYYAEVSAPEGYVLDNTEHKIKATDFFDSLSTAVKYADTVRNYRGTTPDLLNDSDHFAYVIGYMDGNVRPYGLISRAETTTIFFRLLKDSVRDGNLLTSNTYTDVADDYWANTAISTMTGLGIVQGRSTTTFDPKAPITRAQFAAICARFDTGKSSGTQSFTDIKGHWAEKYIERAAELGWIKGFEDGSFRPDTYITRAQAMTMINRVLNRIPEDESDLLPGMNVWPDCNPGDWFYLAVQEATNSHDFEHKAGNYETWTKLMKNPDWTRYEN
ncbi:MAG: S-layer homology domain-containing protein [Dysosmobacter sp.]